MEIRQAKPISNLNFTATRISSAQMTRLENMGIDLSKKNILSKSENEIMGPGYREFKEITGGTDSIIMNDDELRVLNEKKEAINKGGQRLRRKKERQGQSTYFAFDEARNKSGIVDFVLNTAKNAKNLSDVAIANLESAYTRFMKENF